MAEESTFASESKEPVQKTELEAAQESLQSKTVTLDPRTLGVIQVLMEQQLKAGLIKLTDIDALVMVRDEVAKANIEYQTFLQRTQTRIQELTAKDAETKRELYELKLAESKNVAAIERQQRKTAEKELAELKEKLETLQKGITKKPSKAFATARALNPEPSESEKMQDELEPIFPPSDPMENWDKPEVEDISSSLENIEEEIKKADSIDEQMEIVSNWEEPEVVETPTEDGGPDEVKVQDEEVETEYGNFTKPVISASNAPNITAKVSEPENIVASVDEEKEVIPTYDSEEELLAAAQAKLDAKAEEETEEEFEEVTIPNPDELNKMTKATIFGEAQSLGFDSVVMTMTKTQMVEAFTKETEDFIANLQESGDFISAETTKDSENDEDTIDRQDGGYF
tara:strand:+ start:1742 stop:2938 length:1197 start_codon:yes stop_codon:yes gene_type:complete